MNRREDDELPELLFEPFNSEATHDDVDTWNAPARLVFYFDDDEAPLRLAQELIAHFRGHREGDGELCVDGRMFVTHNQEDSLPPLSLDFEKLPVDLQHVVDAYRKTEARTLLAELDRLNGIIEALESDQSDSYFNNEENEHRALALAAQDRALGSRVQMRERTKWALDALRFYASGGEGADCARQALAFVEREMDPEDSRESEGEEK